MISNHSLEQWFHERGQIIKTLKSTVLVQIPVSSLDALGLWFSCLSSSSFIFSSYDYGYFSEFCLKMRKIPKSVYERTSSQLVGNWNRFILGQQLPLASLWNKRVGILKLETSHPLLFLVEDILICIYSHIRI